MSQQRVNTRTLPLCVLTLAPATRALWPLLSAPFERSIPEGSAPTQSVEPTLGRLDGASPLGSPGGLLAPVHVERWLYPRYDGRAFKTAVYPAVRAMDTCGMSKRLVDIDDDLLEQAAAILGASTMKETVNRSLEAVVLTARRHRRAERLAKMSGLDLADQAVMAGAWL